MSFFRISLTPTERIIVSFAAVILTGSILLSLPISQLANSQASYWDNLFTAVSMVCVTGLFTQPVASSFTAFGQIICMILMQIGGLSLLSFIGMIALQAKRKLSFINLTTLQESFSRDDTKDFHGFILSVFRFTFAIEGMGALLLAIYFVPKFGWAKGVFTSIFLAISAFCNAGFDNMGASSLVYFVKNPYINLIIASLIIMGGLGFSVWFDLQTQVKKKNHVRKFSFHTKVVLGLTATILALGTLLTLMTEYNNPNTIGTFSLGHKVLASFFQTVTMRTAGFATIDYTQARPISLLLYAFQMMLGGAPGGTAGGIKITAFLVLLVYARSEVLGLPYTNFKHRTIDTLTIRKAIAVFIVFLSTFLLGLFSISVTDSDKPLLFLIFEVMSALATVGVTANLTPSLTQAGQFIIMALMFFGRIGPMSILMSLSSKRASKTANLQYAKSSLIV
ncbi:Trk family potassium uptake protein [Streptococcus varani]|uniref:Trk family potassium uptake protein n=1 Tax=Streptococcus varani TaxID=1608583 RepID=A0A0E4H5J0_9STRE|nr:potassium transporter TrkG [Streptococcus varani]CQR25798.1 Trk family potassium uptake protein [Streptococcus varani]